MRLEYSNSLFNPTSEENTPEIIFRCLRHSQEQVRHFVVDAAKSVMSFNEAERNI